MHCFGDDGKLRNARRRAIQARFGAVNELVVIFEVGKKGSISWLC
jgi:hypothetical protein